jgi:hypothetical protein
LKSLTARLFLVICILTNFSAHSKTRTEANLGHIFLGVGNVFLPATVRVGHHQYEFGILDSEFLGAVYLVDVYEDIFSSIGVGYHFEKSMGIYGSVGWEFLKWEFLTVRGEFSAHGTYKNTTLATLLIGISAHI